MNVLFNVANSKVLERKSVSIIEQQTNRREPIVKITLIAGILAAAIGLQAAAAQAQECQTFTSGEILCDDGYYLHYWSPTAEQWQVLDREATAAALGLGPEYPAGSDSERSSTVYGSNGSLTKEGGCTMFSSPGYGFGESLSFSSGC